MVSHRHIPDIHREPINRVMFEPESSVVMTSSESDNTSVVFINVALKQEPYIWRFKQVIVRGVMRNSNLKSLRCMLVLPIHINVS